MLNIYSHNPHSNGARELARALGIQRIRHGRSNYVGGPRKTVINWGSGTELPGTIEQSHVLNDPRAVARNSNKRTFFETTARSCRVVPATQDRGVAEEWNRTHAVVARTIINGHSGAGIVVIEPNSGVDIPRAPLYTRYVKKTAEYRVHIVDEVVIDLQRKIRDPDFQGEPNWRVRSHQNGFIYVRNGVEEACPRDVTAQALACMHGSGLDFGAVDVIWNQADQQAYVLEVNTAPGLTGQTVESYANAFRPYLR